jgi:nonribosomal peptide synthetase DhbF
MYGITEVTVHATWKELPASLNHAPPSPIGQPLPHLTISILTRVGNEVGPGEVGEMWIAGPSLAAGYLNNTEATAERFRPLPSAPSGPRYYRTGDLARRLEDGELDFVGRTDDQVKLRGYRIELAEVEYALRHSRAVHDAAALVVWTRSGDGFLVGLVIPEPGYADQEVEAGARAAVRETLPPHAVPNRISVVRKLPVTPSGKLDRQALVALASQRRP